MFKGIKMAKKDKCSTECMAKMNELVSTLNEKQKDIISQEITLHQYKKNEVIYRYGDTPKYMYCLLSGKIKVYKEGVGGRNQIIRVAKPVEYFGYRAYFANGKFITAAATLEPSCIAKIPLDTIKGLILENAELGWFFIRTLCQELGRSDQRTVNLTQKHIRGRLAESLLFLKERYGVEADGYTLSIYLSREDLANLSNMTTSNAIRTLSLFAADKLVLVDGRKIKIIDEERLRQISRLG